MLLEPMTFNNMEILPRETLCVNSYEDAATIQRILLNNGNAVLMTREEKLWVLNWIWCESGYSNRNDVVFVDRGTYEMALYNEGKDKE